MTLFWDKKKYSKKLNISFPYLETSEGNLIVDIPDDVLFKKIPDIVYLLKLIIESKNVISFLLIDIKTLNSEFQDLDYFGAINFSKMPSCEINNCISYLEKNYKITAVEIIDKRPKYMLRIKPNYTGDIFYDVINFNSKDINLEKSVYSCSVLKKDYPDQKHLEKNNEVVINFLISKFDITCIAKLHLAEKFENNYWIYEETKSV